MRKIYKYDLNPGVDKTILLSASAHVVHVGQQVKNLVTAWIECDPEADPQLARTYMIVGTGQAIPAGAKHVGSAICPPFVWHVYELPWAKP